MLDYAQIFRTNNDLKSSKKEKKKKKGVEKRRYKLQEREKVVSAGWEAASGCWDFSLRVWKIKSLLAVFYYGVPFEEPNKTSL